MNFGQVADFSPQTPDPMSGNFPASVPAGSNAMQNEQMQKIIQLLLNKSGNQASDGGTQFAGGWAVPKSQGEGLANIGSSLLSAYMGGAGGFGG